MKNSQKEIILNYLIEGKKISQRKAIAYWGIIRLGAIIYSLKKDGIPIKTISKDNILFKGKYVEYYIEKEFIKKIKELDIL